MKIIDCYDVNGKTIPFCIEETDYQVITEEGEETENNHPFKLKSNLEKAKELINLLSDNVINIECKFANDKNLDYDAVFEMEHILKQLWEISSPDGSFE
jgi:hypothetical protein